MYSWSPCTKDKVFSPLLKERGSKLVLRIRFILIWIRTLLRIRPKIEKIPTFVLLSFYKKYSSQKNYVFWCLWGKYLCPLNISLIFIILKNNLWYFYDFGWNFPWFWWIFCYPDPADRNETDPDPQHWLNSSPNIRNKQNRLFRFFIIVLMNI